MHDERSEECIIHKSIVNSVLTDLNDGPCLLLKILINLYPIHLVAIIM